jgi:hypothetical protein
MPLAVEENEPPDPIRVRPLGAQAEVFTAGDVADLIQEFRLAGVRYDGYAGGHDRHFSGLPPGRQAD